MNTVNKDVVQKKQFIELMHQAKRGDGVAMTLSVDDTQDMIRRTIEGNVRADLKVVENAIISQEVK